MCVLHVLFAQLAFHRGKRAGDEMLVVDLEIHFGLI
jgi:hypothetical protein